MNILIEDAESLKFLTSAGQWAANASEGKHYGRTADAYAAAKQEPIGRFNIAGYIKTTKQLITIRQGRGKGTKPGDQEKS
jgi:hypothetical protein